MGRVGSETRLVISDLCSHFTMTSEPHAQRRMSTRVGTFQNGWGCKQMQTESHNKSRRYRGVAAELDEIGVRWTDAWHNQGAAAEADTVGEQQPKRTRSGAAAEADASGEQQLKRAQSGSSSWKRRQTGSNS